MSGAHPFVPAVGNQPLLPRHAKAGEQLGRLLDALLILQVEGSARVADLAVRVGLHTDRLRQLLSSYMVAGADAVGPSAPFSIGFGTEAGVLGAEADDDDLQVEADVVYVSEARAGGALLDDVAMRPTSVDEVVRGLLSARSLLATGRLNDRHREAVEQLAGRLEKAMQVTVSAPIDAVVDQLRRAARDRRRVRFGYRDPWTGERSSPTVEPYQVRRWRDRLYLDCSDDAGRTYDVSGMRDVVVLNETFPRPSTPRRGNDEPTDVVLRIPVNDDRAYNWLVKGWSGEVVGPTGDGGLDVRIRLDSATPNARLGVLLLQLGPGCSVASPPHLRDVAAPVARRLLRTVSCNVNREQSELDPT